MKWEMVVDSFLTKGNKVKTGKHILQVRWLWPIGDPIDCFLDAFNGRVYICMPLGVI